MNDAEQKTRSRLLAAVVLVPLLLVAALWLPRWWEGRELAEARKIAGVGSQLTAGSMTDARRKVDPGLAADKIVAAIGKPGFAVGADGRATTHEIWTYYFSDGTMKWAVAPKVSIRRA